MIIVLIGATGAGKSALTSFLLNNTRMERMEKVTTRPRRENETDGGDYSAFLKEEDWNKSAILFEETFDVKVEGEPVTWRYGYMPIAFDDVSSKIYLTDCHPLTAIKIQEYYGEDNVAIVNVSANYKVRLKRYMQRDSDMSDEDKKIEFARRNGADLQYYTKGFLESINAVEIKNGVDGLDQWNYVCERALNGLYGLIGMKALHGGDARFED